MSPEIQPVIQWALVALIALSCIALGRMDAGTRSAQRIQQAARRNVAEHKRAVVRLKKAAAHAEQLNQARYQAITRFDETIDKIQDKFGVKDDQ